MSDFGKILRKTRIERDLSRTQLCQKLNISYSTLANYENSIREPDFNTLKLLAEYLEVSTDKLLGITRPANQQKTLAQLEKVSARDQELVCKMLSTIIQTLYGNKNS